MRNGFLSIWIVGILLSLLFIPHPLLAQEWSASLRGSWVKPGTPGDGDVTLVLNKSEACEIVVAASEHSAVQRAARFLAADIQKITGFKPPVVAKPTGGMTVPIYLITLGSKDAPAEFPRQVSVDKLKDQWEAYQVVTVDRAVYVVGSNFRGTAFAAYTLSERLGIDPLYLWTGYTPERSETLILRKTNHFAASPTFKYRGLFHDDEDILPRPFERSGYPQRTGNVPLAWYEKFFETALRLRLNQVAPYAHVHRRYEVQKAASDWGLFYTSDYEDTLLSNPFGMDKFGLASERKVRGEWDFLTNRKALLSYWRGGVAENKDLDCIYPLSLRGTDERPYAFPAGVTDDERGRIISDAAVEQIRLTREALPKGKSPLFHFMLFGEMPRLFQSGNLDLPDDAILVWPDDNDGNMRALPKKLGRWKHGVTYHLAWNGPKNSKQNAHTVSPERIADQFKRITKAGATEFVLVSVSELREFTMETRMIADIAWDADAALKGADPAKRFTRWWSREYFGDSAADDCLRVYSRYYDLISSPEKLHNGSDQVHALLALLSKRFTGKTVEPPEMEYRDALQKRIAQFELAMRTIDEATSRMNWQQQQFFYENVTLGLLFDWRPTQSAMRLLEALDEPDNDKAFQLASEARGPLEKLEVEILRAERPPFEKWYAKTWIRRETSPLNVHRPYEELQVFLSTRGQSKLTDPAAPPKPPAAKLAGARSKPSSTPATSRPSAK